MAFAILLPFAALFLLYYPLKQGLKLCVPAY